MITVISCKWVDVRSDVFHLLDGNLTALVVSKLISVIYGILLLRMGMLGVIWI